MVTSHVHRGDPHTLWLYPFDVDPNILQGCLVGKPLNHWPYLKFNYISWPLWLCSLNSQVSENINYNNAFYFLDQNTLSYKNIFICMTLSNVFIKVCSLFIKQILKQDFSNCHIPWSHQRFYRNANSNLVSLVCRPGLYISNRPQCCQYG